MTLHPASAFSLAEHARFIPGKLVTVDFGAAQTRPPYDIVIGHSVLSEAGTLIRLRLSTRRCIIITDTNVAPLYRGAVKRFWRQAATAF